MKYADAVRNPDSRICEVLAGLAAHNFKTWCYPSQEKLCELLKRFTGRDMARRTLNRHLNALERDGMLRRVRRHHHDKQRGMVLRSTLYIIAGRFMSRIHRIVRAAERFAKLRDRSRSGVHVPTPAQYRTRTYKGYTPGT